ncbi:MAG: flagellar protein FlaG [Eubacteriales bacterium]
MRVEGATAPQIHPNNTNEQNEKTSKVIGQQTQQTQTEEKSNGKKVEEKDVLLAIEHANKEFKAFNRRLEFSIHEETKEIVVKVIDTEDDNVIREIPSEKILDMVAKMYEIAGLFVDEKR